MLLPTKFFLEMTKILMLQRGFWKFANLVTIVGMDGVDKEKVQRIVYEMSKGSKYFENEQRKEAYIKGKIENMRAHCAKLTATDIAHYQKVN